MIFRGKLFKRRHALVLLSIHLTGESSIALMVANRSKDNKRHQALILAPLALLDQYGP